MSEMSEMSEMYECWHVCLIVRIQQGSIQGSENTREAGSKPLNPPERRAEATSLAGGCYFVCLLVRLFACLLVTLFDCSLPASEPVNMSKGI